MKKIWIVLIDRWKKLRKSGKAFFIFMIAMLFLTIFNANIQKLLLPYVTVEKPKSGNIYIKVRGNGTLVSGESNNICVSAEKQIKEIYVSVGDVVKKGQPLISCENANDEYIESAQEELTALEDEYEKSMLEQSAEYGVDQLIIYDAEEQLALAMDKLEKVKSNRAEYDANEAQITKEKETLEKLKEDLEKAKGKLGEKQLIDTTELEKEIKQIEEQIKDETISEEDAKKLASDLEKKNNSLEKIKEKNKKIQSLIDGVDVAQENYDKKEGEIQNLQDRQDALLSEGIDVDEARLEVNQKQIALKQYQLDEKKEAVDFDTLSEKMSEKKDEIESLSDDKNNQLLAETDGVIQEILCQQGDIVQKNQSVILMSPLQTSYKFSFEINKAMADYVSVGDEAKVLNVWNEDVLCKLINIKASSESPDQCLVLEFSAEGENLAIGQNIAVSVGETKQYYDIIIPQCAVNEDNEGSFVFVLRTQNSAFGNRYYVERVDVQVLESDETQVAVLGALEENDYIVTLSTKPLEDFEKVRLVD